MTIHVSTRSYTLPRAMMTADTTTKINAQLATISRRERWVEVLKEFPVDNRVLWTVDAEKVSLYYRVAEEVPEGGARA